ncbi:MAG: cyanophycinase [Bacillota bacterium]|nr:cyanophycinase [Bacillota bacterium]
MGHKVRGNLVIIGGAEDLTGECVILREVVRLSGGRRSAIVVITAASADHEEAGETYRHVFQKLGAESVAVLNLTSRNQAQRPEEASQLERATGVFMPGGDQLRITAMLGGTPVYRALQERYEAGVVICGTSAGASVMSGAMIVGGREDEAPTKERSVRMAPGLGLVEEVVIDQHFAQRGRIGRLLSAVAQNPYVMGLGIDEDTAVVLNARGVFRVIGSNSVTLVDGTGITHSNVSESDFSRILALTDVKIHVLPSGYGFDLSTRRPALAAEVSGWIEKENE